MHSFVRNGDILGDLFLPEQDKANGVGIVWCPGLPNTTTYGVICHFRFLILVLLFYKLGILGAGMGNLVHQHP